MADCENCGGKTHNAYLCPRCTNNLRIELGDLPWWIMRLQESAVGQVKLGDTGRRQPPTGLARYTDPDDGDDNLQRDLQAGKFTLDKVLAKGGVNARAVRQLETIHAALTEILATVKYPDNHVAPPTTSALAWMLSQRVTVLAAHADAGRWYDDICDLPEQIRKIINPPVAMRWLGKCPTWDEKTRQTCGHELRAPEDAPEVFCRKCRQPHNPDRLQLLMMNDLESKELTVQQLLDTNRILPQEYRIPERTFRHWRQNGKLQPRAHNPAGEPLYAWSDIRKLRTAGKATA